MAGAREVGITVAGRVLSALFPARRWPPDWQPNSILVVKTCCLGDVLMATPTFSALRQAFPSARITALVGSWSKDALAGNPDVDEIIDCGDLGSGKGYGLSDYVALATALRRRRFDCCFVLERSAFLATLPWLAGIPSRVGLDSGGRGFSLNIRVPCPTGRHEAEAYLDTVRATGTGIPVERQRLRFCPSDEDRTRASELLSVVGTTRPIVAIHPGGGVNPGMSLVSKRWSAARFAAIADRLADNGYQVILVGGGSDRRVADDLIAAATHAPFDLIGKPTLGQLGALFERCALVIANDTGPMHLAVAVGASVVAIFGPSDPAVYGPYGQPTGIVSRRLACSPCFRQGKAPLCTNHRCMAEISVDEVWRVVQDRLAHPGDESGISAVTAHGEV